MNGHAWFHLQRLHQPVKKENKQKIQNENRCLCRVSNQRAGHLVCLQWLGRGFCRMGHFQLFSMISKFSMGHFLSFYTDFNRPFSKLMGLWRMAPCLPNHCVWLSGQLIICVLNSCSTVKWQVMCGSSPNTCNRLSIYWKADITAVAYHFEVSLAVNVAAAAVRWTR